MNTRVGCRFLLQELYNSMDFSRPEYWSGLPFSPPGIELGSPGLQADFLLSEPPGKPISVLVHAFIKKYCRLGGLNNRNFFLIVQEAGESKIKILSSLVPG